MGAPQFMFQTLGRFKPADVIYEEPKAPKIIRRRKFKAIRNRNGHGIHLLSWDGELYQCVGCHQLFEADDVLRNPATVGKGDHVTLPVEDEQEEEVLDQ